MVEIGPGEGALTWPLVEKCAGLGCKILAIEKDEQLVDKMWKKGSGYRVQGIGKNVEEILEVVAGDALGELPKITSKLKAISYKLVGNIPYYITGQILRVIGELENKPSLTVLMVQKEVAERVAAKPPKMNLLAAATQVWADVSLLFSLKPKDFSPSPKINSSVIKLQLATEYEKGHEYTKEKITNYYKTIKAVFKQPRKTLLNNIQENKKTGELENGRTKKQEYKGEVLNILKKMGFDEKTRGQSLSIDDLLRLADFFNE